MKTKKKNQLVEKVIDGAFKFKSYWKKPPQGYQVSYKEFATFALGSGAPNIIGVMVTYTTLMTTTHLMISHFKLSTGMAWLLAIFAALVTLVRSPILSMIIDNSNGKKGKFKPFLLRSSIGAAISFSIIPYIPYSWNDIHLFSFRLPAIPIMGVHEASTLDFSLAILLAFVLVQVGLFFSTLLNQCMAGLDQTISCVAQERANIGAIKGLFSNLPSSVIGIFLPVLAGTVFASKGGWNSVEMYRLIFPICGVLGVMFVSVLINGVEERVVVNQEYVARVKFWDGVKMLSKSKHFWILNLFNVFFIVRGLSNLAPWITQYSFESDTVKTWVGLYCSTLLMNAIAIALLIGPVLIKKIGKKNVMLFSCIGYAVTVLIQLIFYKNPIVILVLAFFQNIFGGFYYVPGIMTSDIMDEIQMKTGKRLEGFWQNYSEIIKTICLVFTGMLTPLFLSFGGVGFSDDLSVALADATTRDNIFFYQSLLALIGAVLTAIPFFFYTLKEKDHANIVRVLRIRAAAENYHDNKLQTEDVLHIQEIVDFVKENDVPMVKEELEKHDCIDDIVQNYDEYKAKHDADEQKILDQEFVRNVEFETKRMESKLAKAKKKAEKNGENFDQQAFIDDFIENSRFLKDNINKNT